MSDLIQNRKARHEYEILETLEAGICLMGSEIKSLRAHGGSLQEAYIDVKKNGPYLIEAHIPVYSHSGLLKHEEKRPRKLLLHKKEILKLKKAKQEKGLTIVPLAIYLNKKGLAKVKVAIARGKKLHDKRRAMKEKELKAQIRKVG